MLAPAPPGAAQEPPADDPPEREVVFVLDGSRSIEPDEWRALTRGVDVSLRRRDHLPLGQTTVSVIVFTGPGPLGQETPLTQRIIAARPLETEEDAAEIGSIVRGHTQIEGATAVTAGLRDAASVVAHPGAETKTTVCLLTDGIENVQGETVGSVDFLPAAGVDRFSVVAARTAVTPLTNSPLSTDP